MLTRNTVVLAKVENGGYGVDPSPTAADDAILVANPSVKVNGELLTRDNVRATLSPQGHAVGRKKVSVTFDTEIKGSGTAADDQPEIGVLFKGCGMKETVNTGNSVVYAPRTTGQESITLYVYFDGLLHKVTGARGTFSLDAAAGQFAKISWSFEGKYNTPEDQPLPTSPVFNNAATPPVVISANFTTDSFSAVINNLSFDMANSIASPGSVNSTDGYGELRIAGRDPNGSFNPEATVRGTEDFWADWESATQKAISMTIGSAAYNTCKIDIPQAMYREIGYGDRDGIRTYEIPYTAAGTDSGDDEISITFS